MNLSPAQRQTLTWLGLGFAAALLLWLLAPVLTPFVIGAVLAYALHPMVERLAARRVPRVLAVLVVEVAFIVALLAVLLLIVPIITRELPLLREQIPQLAARLNETVTPWLAQFGIELALDIPGIKTFVLKYLDSNFEEWLAAALSSARIGGSIVLSLVGNAVLVPVVLFYLLMDWPRLVERVLRLVPPRLLPRFTGFIDECDAMLGQYLRGQFLVMGILAVYYAGALAAFGFDLAVPVGVFTGLAVFIPYLGFGLGLVLALLAGVLQFSSLYGVIAVAIVYGVGQVVESLVLTPRLVGERIGMNPLMVIFALLAFGQLFGFVGVLVALPVSAVLVVAVRRIKALYLSSHLYGG
ncbi:MAG: AI-2E family transporter [Ideonella sp.]|jgi:predicted PurR-regulated permease PerM|nr:AI-2E family transporter [Ideonella sp.]